jgi:hypothetical protein
MSQIGLDSLRNRIIDPRIRRISNMSKKGITKRGTLMQEKPSRPQGEVRVRVIDHSKGGNPVVVDEKVYKNLLVNTFYSQLISLIGGANSYPISKVDFGNDSTPPSNGDTGVISWQYSKAVGSVSFPTPFQVEFNTTLGTGEYPQGTIAEAALMFLTSPAATCAARVVIGPITKNSQISVQLTWMISWTV